MKIGVLTSSRADYSIYYPLLKAIREDSNFELHIIAFGTHLSKKHGHTVSAIKQDGYTVTEIETVPQFDSPEAISISMGTCIDKFAAYWSNESFDIVFCLGDRYEMFAACAAAVPFNVRLAHIHGGEETTGAIDDAFRHSITHMSSYHFTAAEPYMYRVRQLKGNDHNIYNVGSLSIDNLKHLQLLSLTEFQQAFNIDLSRPSILITYHPETIDYDANRYYVSQLVAALHQIKDYQLVITMPNADTMANLMRENLQNFIDQSENAVGVESFGTVGYLSCMKHCSFMLGNTSSGFIEASYFPKYVINLGNRQKGRIITPNIWNCQIDQEAILAAVRNYRNIILPPQIDIYGTGNTAEAIISVIRQIND